MDDEEKEYASMFFDLSSRRTLDGNIISKIPYPEIKSYLELYGVYDVEKFLHYIKMMDTVYVECMSKKLKQEIDRLKRKGSR